MRFGKARELAGARRQGGSSRHETALRLLGAAPRGKLPHPSARAIGSLSAAERSGLRCTAPPMCKLVAHAAGRGRGR